MASAFGHALVAYTIGKSFSKTIFSKKFWIICVVLSILPDADVLSFKFGIPYESFWGHRGFTHSLVFAFLISAIVMFVFYWKINWQLRTWWTIFLCFFISTSSHGLLDAMTDGGRGVAFFSPFDNSRYFLPWRPIRISPVGASKFFSDWGLQVIKSELVWIALPCVAYLSAIKIFRK